MPGEITHNPHSEAMTKMSLHTDEQNRPEHNARDLTAGGVAATIRLDGQTYTLRITRMGKLILTK